MYPGISDNKSELLTGGFNYYHHPNNIPGTVFQGADNDSNSNGIIDGLNFSLFTVNHTESDFLSKYIDLVYVKRLGSYKIKNTLVSGISNIIDSAPAGFTPLTWIEDTNANTVSSVLSDYLTRTGVTTLATKI